MEKQILIPAIVKALAFTENGGKPNINNPTTGKTGEMKSIFQFTPGTWKAYSKQVLGQEAPITNENEVKVVGTKVANWVDQGYTPEQIGSMWNAGPGEPNAHTGKFSDGSPSVGVNKKYGVKYNVPAYAKKVNDYTDKFMADLSRQSPQNNLTNETTPQTSQLPVTQPIQSGLLSRLGKATPAPKATPGLVQSLV